MCGSAMTLSIQYGMFSGIVAGLPVFGRNEPGRDDALR